MIGVIAGDIIGSRYEFTKDKRYDFEPLFHPKSKFTDDTICSTAVMRSFNDDSCPTKTLHSHCRAYFSTGGWGQRFIQCIPFPASRTGREFEKRSTLRKKALICAR